MLWFHQIYAGMAFEMYFVQTMLICGMPLAAHQYHQYVNSTMGNTACDVTSKQLWGEKNRSISELEK